MFEPNYSEWSRRMHQDKQLRTLRRINIVLAMIMITLITIKAKQLYDLSNIYTGS